MPRKEEISSRRGKRPEKKKESRARLKKRAGQGLYNKRAEDVARCGEKGR